MRKDETRAQAVERIKNAYTSIKEHDSDEGVVFTVWIDVLSQHFQAHPEPFDDVSDADHFRAMLAEALHTYLVLESAE
jgi:hypothetical protein